jgi:thiol-disulfide isomerase/thioredoxin
MKRTHYYFLILAVFLAGFLIFRNLNRSSDSAFLPEIVPSNQYGINLGDTAPNLSFENPEGNLLSLHSLRGNLVLIDFWAAWCSPCRRENPNIVKAWEKYKDKEFINGKGFTVFGVSLDDRREQWIMAIEEDGLDWPYHVSDLKGWNSVPSALYQVRAIPASFLIDGDGVIIARNLKGDDLHKALQSLLKK